jgi:uncharacterized protein (TIGR02118 family)
MVRLMVLYPRLADPVEFERHYFTVHVPIVRRLPGLRRYNVGRRPSRVRGPEPYQFVAELDWEDLDSMERDFASEWGRRAARDVEELERFAPGIQSMVFELEEA